jgi:hypothetical protein
MSQLGDWEAQLMNPVSLQVVWKVVQYISE